MMDRQAFIDRYIAVYLERWRANLARVPHLRWADDSVVRVEALTLAETSWQMHYADYDESRMPEQSGRNEGHGHVWPRPDGMKARCGGPNICNECARDLAQMKARTSDAMGRSDVMNAIERAKSDPSQANYSGQGMGNRDDS